MATITQDLADLRQSLRQPALVAWVLYIVLIPFYLFTTGLPQPGDMLIVVVVPLALAKWNWRLRLSDLRVIRPLIAFTGWIIVVNLFWAVILWEFGRDLLPPIFYIYNSLIFFTVIILYQRFGDSFLRVTLYAFVALTLFLVLTSFVRSSSSYRDKLFFSNANQLGYYALLAACIITVTQQRVGFGVVRSSIALTGCAYLALLSASRSALIGIAVLFALLLISRPRMIIALGIAGGLLLAMGGPVDRAIGTSQQRLLESRDTGRGFFEGRGYDRIASNMEYLVAGAGEGHTGRFKETTSIGALEIHSSAGTILFSYGVIGAGLFLNFLWKLVSGARLRAAMMLVPPLLYTVAHQGLRFTPLWVLLAIFVVTKARPALERIDPTRAQPRGTNQSQASTSLMISPSRR